MTSPDDTQAPAPSKPTTSAGWKWFMKASGVLAMALFLLPTFYVIKYYAFDAGREARLIQQIAPDDAVPRATAAPDAAAKTAAINSASSHPDPDLIPVFVAIAQHDSQPDLRVSAIHAVGVMLQSISTSFLRPMETLKAKSTLAEMATNEKDPNVRKAAQEELGKIAQGGVVVRR